MVTQIFLDFWEARVMVDQNDVAGAPAPAMLSAKRGVAALAGWRKMKTTTVAALLCAGCVGALSGGATVALMNAAQGGGAGILDPLRAGGGGVPCLDAGTGAGAAIFGQAVALESAAQNRGGREERAREAVRVQSAAPGAAARGRVDA